MKTASLVFWLVCAIPLAGIMFYLFKKDKIKGGWGMLLFVAFVLFAIVTVIYLSRDFAPEITQ